MGTAFRLERHVNAPIETVWQVLSNHGGYRDFTPLPTSKLVTQGKDEANGVGAVRRLGAGPVSTDEEVIVFDAPNHMAYKVVRGLPIRDHRADVRLTEAADGTAVTYEGDFRPMIPGTGALIGLVMSTSVRQLIGGIAKAAEERARKAAA